MTFAKLIEKISDEYSIELLSQGEDTEIQDVALIDSRHEPANRSTLYFGYDKQLKHAGSVPSQCIVARTDPAAPPLSTGGNIALVTEDSLFPIFNDAKALIEATRKGIFEELTALADKTHSIEAVIDAASVRLGNSLLFCDMNFKIIAASSSVPVLDPLWIENTKQGYCCYEFISEVKKLKSIRNASQTTAAIEVTCNKSPYRKLSCKVFHNQTQIGFLLLIEGENNVLPSHFEMLSTTSHVISYTISYYTWDLFEKNSLYHKLLYDMLIGAPSKDLMPRLAELQFPAKMLVLFIRPARYPGQPYLKNMICKKLKIQIPGTHVTYHKNGIVAVIPLKEDRDIEIELLEQLKYFSQKEHLRIGISHSFSSIENFVSHYEQAHAALELGHKRNPKELVFLYQNYQIFDLLSEVKNPDKIRRFCHPALAVLNQYDHENNSQLYKTLCVFLEKGCNIKLTSESLYIHRNSLVYRLNRITEISRVDLSDINTRFLLRLSFLIDRYHELKKSLE
ncbi:PucR family transcriptional regulator [Lacrimispora saccharolytica]|uniref:Transcriptional regulator, CdaR n=1 Tax=Lacrimispora saccharolytica (strain ATCC 35040 / DSM 2544 / NRCC 2533 / WM1) TaxID=610130 RepID=D9R5Q4_LACSW|nr:helix-turn-helix domain-containing protein [Lacrimispora saccharolytica]ADL05237.1 transcriptional regulator, CdaR [[Clostridium] saccharolyticum WM1]QRV20587.1 helix-turn-helix domain-containing protein [Lacrimispora saccharolytica]